MNITKESEDYYKIYTKSSLGVKLKNPIVEEFKGNLELTSQLENEKDNLRLKARGSKAYSNAMYQAQQNLKDKLKTTPSAGLTFIGKTFNISKLWKRVSKFLK